jgi:phospholipid-translocating ATPase
MLLSFWLFEKSFTTIVTITFTALIFSELLNVFTTLTKWSKMVCLAQLFTLVVYLASIIFLR